MLFECDDCLGENCNDGKFNNDVDVCSWSLLSLLSFNSLSIKSDVNLRFFRGGSLFDSMDIKDSSFDDDVCDD